MAEPETKPSGLGLMRRMALGCVSLLIGAAIWVPCLHLAFTPSAAQFRSTNGLSPVSRQLAARHLRLWTDPESRRLELDQMRISNPEWDYMGRTFLALSLANACLRAPDKKAEYLHVLDLIIDDTERLLAEGGDLYFLMEYAREAPFVQQPSRSLFIDGELAAMVAARRFVEERTFSKTLNERVDLIVERMSASPVLCCESYPDECWMYCNAVALAAVKMNDVLDKRDHSAFLKAWVDSARERLTDKKTGLLVSSFTYRGHALDGPEGSTLWMTAHALQVVDADFAKSQYDGARKALYGSCLGFAWAREWPESWRGPMDVDSGPVIPVFEISAGSSGLAFVGAAAFGDDAYYKQLAATLRFSAFPYQRRGELKFCASNQVGDAVLLYSTVLGPLWDEVRKRERAGGAK